MSLSIKIKIANRVYPMTINSDDEESVRRSVKNIEERIKFYEKNYAIQDRQDLLAMCLIEIGSKLESIRDNTSKGNTEMQEKLSNIESALSDTFSLGLLDYPHYTQPRIIDDKEVPEVLVSGHHEKIESWRQSHRESRTRDKRPDLWEKYKKIRKSE